MKRIAGFRWDGSGKTISYMVIDEHYQIRCVPVIKKLDTENQKKFQDEAEKVIQEFFTEIENIHRTNSDAIKIEYRIVAHGSPAALFQTKMHKPSKQTEYVKEKFFEQHERVNQKNGNGSLQLAKSQWRAKLKKPALTEFNDGLYRLHVVKKKKNNAYQCHLWALTLHATKSNYKKLLKKLTKALLPAQDSQKAKKKRRAA